MIRYVDNTVWILASTIPRETLRIDERELRLDEAFPKAFSHEHKARLLVGTQPATSEIAEENIRRDCIWIELTGESVRALENWIPGKDALCFWQLDEVTVTISRYFFMQCSCTVVPKHSGDVDLSTDALDRLSRELKQVFHFRMGIVECLGVKGLIGRSKEYELGKVHALEKADCFVPEETGRCMQHLFLDGEHAPSIRQEIDGGHHGLERIAIPL